MNINNNKYTNKYYLNTRVLFNSHPRPSGWCGRPRSFYSAVQCSPVGACSSMRP